MCNLAICLCMHVCEFRCGSICVHPFTHGIEYMFVCMHSVCICMYVSIHNFISACEQCMLNNGCIEALHIWHICI